MRGPRPALLVAGVLAVVLTGLVVVLATSEPAALKIAKSPLVGKPAPAVTGERLIGEGEVPDLAAGTGRFVLVNFFATWCAPCRKEHPELVRFATTHAAIGDASVLTVAFSDADDEVRRYFAEEGGDWPVLRDPGGRMAVAWGVAKMPESYLVAPDGTVLAKISGGVTADALDALVARFTRQS